MIVTIHQPDFLPWLGFFDRWRKADLYIILDNVQFLRRGWHHRDKIKTKDGVKWLTVPVIKRGKYTQLIREVQIDNEVINWRNKHLKTLQASYKKAPYFEHCFARLQAVYERKQTFLLDLNLEILEMLAQELHITTPTVLASDYVVTSTSSRRLLDLLALTGGTVYLSGLGAKNYLNETLFKENNIEVRWQQFQHPIYNQLHGEFIPMLSSLDFCMMNSNAFSQ